MIILLLIPFLLFKLLNVGVRLSDANVYYYQAYKLLEGGVLYKDVHFTIFPLFAYITALYQKVFLGSLTAYFATASLEVFATGLLLHRIAQKQFQNVRASFIVVLSYLSSFILLSTSDFQTGVFIATLFGIGAYYFFLEKRLFLVGICTGLAIATKLYFVPLFLAYVCTLIVQKNYKKILPLCWGTLGVLFLVMLPTMLFAWEDFLRDASYAVSRPQGVSKLGIVFFFVRHDFLLFVAFAYSFFTFKKSPFLFFVCAFTLFEFVAYGDIYYLYINVVVPYLAIALGQLYVSLPTFFADHKKNAHSVAYVLLFMACFYNLYAYLTGYMRLQKFDEFDHAASVIRIHKPDYLYGATDITPALSYATGVPLLGGVIDTNANLFRKGLLSKTRLTQLLLKTRTILVTQGAYYPGHPYHTEFVDPPLDMKDAVAQKCKMLESYPVQTEGFSNRINLFACF